MKAVFFPSGYNKFEILTKFIMNGIIFLTKYEQKKKKNPFWVLFK